MGRLLDDGRGGVKKYPFAYGQYCRGAYPPDRLVYEGNRGNQLVEAGPPMDAGLH